MGYPRARSLLIFMLSLPWGVPGDIHRAIALAHEVHGGVFEPVSVFLFRYLREVLCVFKFPRTSQDEWERADAALCAEQPLQHRDHFAAMMQALYWQDIGRFDSAVTVLEQVVQHGFVPAMNSLGYCREQRAVPTELYLPLYRRGMQQGYLPALNNYAVWLEDVEPMRALLLHEENARRGYMKSIINLARCYTDAIGVPTAEPETAEQLLRAAIAAQPEYMLPCYALAQLLSGSENSERQTEALAVMTRVAEAGDPDAMSVLANWYERGHIVAADPVQSMQWLERAVAAGDRAAMCSLGVVYHNGEGVPVDTARATDLYRRSAELGEPQGMYNLAMSYREGVPPLRQSMSETMRWLESAAQQMHPDAFIALASLYTWGEGDLAADPSLAEQNARRGLRHDPLRCAGSLALVLLTCRVPPQPQQALVFARKALSDPEDELAPDLWKENWEADLLPLPL